MLGPWPCPRPRALLLSTLVVVFFAAPTIATDCGSNHPDLTTGNNSCCTTSNLCSEGEGDCDSDSECEAGLLCGEGTCSWNEHDPTDDCCETTNVTTIMETSRGDDMAACGVQTTTTKRAGKQASCYQNVYLCDAGDHGQDEGFCEMSDNMDQIRACFINRCVPASAKHCSSWNAVQASLAWNTSVGAWSGQGTGKVDMNVKCTFVGREALRLSPDVATLVSARSPEAQSGALKTDLNAKLTQDVNNLAQPYLWVEEGWHPQVANLAIAMDVHTASSLTTSNSVATEFRDAIATGWGFPIEQVTLTATANHAVTSGVGVMANFTVDIGPPTACTDMTFATFKPGIISEATVLKYGDGSYHPTMAFDGVRATAWRWYIVSAGSFTESWIKYDFEHREIITRYAIVADGEGYPKGWSLGGSNNNSTFTGLSTQSNQLFYGEDTELTFSFSNVNAYRWYRLLINAIDVQGMVDPWLSVREVKFFRCETTGTLAGDVCTGSGPAHKRPHCMTDASGTYSTFLNGGAR